MLYECDPSKNKECKGRNYCMYDEDNKYRECRLTTHKEYAKEGAKMYTIMDGKMVEVKVD